MSKIDTFANYGAKNFKRVLKKWNNPNCKTLGAEYKKRYKEYVCSEDWGEKNFRLSSFLNMFLGITSCKITMEQGYSFEDSIKIFDDLCLGMRKLVRRVFLIADALPNGFKLVTKSLINDLTTDKKECWDFEILSNTDEEFEYKIHKCLYLETCEKYGIRDFCQVFCNHDNWAYDDLHRHVKFVRHSTLVNGECCHDIFIKTKKVD